jgi:hypothetical protein
MTADQSEMVFVPSGEFPDGYGSLLSVRDRKSFSCMKFFWTIIGFDRTVVTFDNMAHAIKTGHPGFEAPSDMPIKKTCNRVCLGKCSGIFNGPGSCLPTEGMNGKRRSAVRFKSFSLGKR